MKVGTDGVLLGAWADVSGVKRILDIGTGTGLIALMLAQRSHALIDAVEIEVNAFEQAQENVIRSAWGKRINVLHADFLDFFETQTEKYDLIVSNPPYFNNSLKAPLKERSMARHNDELQPSKLLVGVNKILSRDGRFCVILPYVESQLFIVDAVTHGLYCVQKVNIIPAPHKKANRILMEFSRTRQKNMERELLIRNEVGEYSEDYKKLTSEFYLFF